MVRILINMHQRDDNNSLGLAIKNTVRVMERAFDFELRRTAGITLSQARVIRALTLGEDGMTQREIAEVNGIEAPTLVPLIDRMEQAGLLERRQDEADRRNNRVYLTDKSRQLWDAMEESLGRVRKAAHRGIPKEDIETVRQVLYRMAQNATDYLESQALKAEEIQK
jgi:MarR family transcriptional regulator for hemolysin